MRSKNVFIASALMFLLGALAAAQLPRQGERSAPMAPGGSLNLFIPVGSVHIRAAADSELRLSYRIHRHHFAFFGGTPKASRARLRFEVRGGSAIVRFSYPPHTHNTGSIEVTLDVPARTNLHVKLGVGAIRIGGGVVGDKFLSTGVGAIRLGLGSKPDYRSVRLSTGVGAIEGGPWGSGQGFVAKALAAHPGGQFRLRAHTGVGAIQMHG